MLCLINIKSLKDFIIGEKIRTDIDCTVTKYLYYIKNDLWYSNDEKTMNNLYFDFKEYIKNHNDSRNHSDKIFINPYLLIHFIILRLYNENVIKQLFIPFGKEKELNNKEIKKLFFFELNLFYICKNCGEHNQNYEDCCLEIQMQENNIKNDIVDLVKIMFEDDTTCIHCGKKVTAKRKMLNISKYLIIVINNDDVKRINTYKIEKSIDLTDIYRANIFSKTNYKLVSFIYDRKFVYHLLNKDWFIYDIIHPFNNLDDQRILYKRNILPKQLEMKKEFPEEINNFPTILIYELK